MINCPFWIKLIFYFPGTVLHEFAHYVAALLLGKADGFSVIPERAGDTYIPGSVKSRTRYKVLSAFVAMAPLIWWLGLFLFLTRIHIIGTDHRLPHIRFGAVLERLRPFRLSDVFFLWLFLQILWAGRLSRADIKNVFTGIFSLSGFVLIGIATAACYFLHG
jgi:hypothetical protein